ncbi:MAG: phage tail protein [Burkholderiales bacterium]|nr:phage tail protein [Burkholderiales bacterium]
MSDPFLGEIKMAGFNFAPSGWAQCSGQLMAINQNTALFALLGTSFGGNGQTTFGLPDLRGRSPVGTGTGLGLSPIVQGEQAGTEAVTLTASSLPEHSHTLANLSGTTATSVAIPVATTGTGATTPANNMNLGPATAAGRPVDIYSTTATTTTLAAFNAAGTATITPPANAIGFAGNSMPVPIRNPFLGLNMIIALTGIYPSHG